MKAVTAIAGEAASMALSTWREGAPPTLRVWDKFPGSPVCDADLAVDRFLKERLGALTPGAGWLSEETADDPARLDRSLLWLVDPIDGTRDYVRGRRGWAVSVALVQDGVLLLGVLAAPARAEMWTAELGRGAWCNGAALAAAERSELAGARVPADTLPKVDRDLIAVAKPNSIALRMAMIANAEADLVATVRWGNEWDIAAAALIASEAGAAVTDAHGRPIAFNKPDPRDYGMICSAAGIHGAAVARLAERAKS